MVGGLLHMAWNLWLATVAVALAYALAATLRARARSPVRALGVVTLGAAWLLMLPNTCYLFTEVRHLFDALTTQGLWDRAHASRTARWELAIRASALGVYAAAGAITFGLSVRVVREAIEARGLRTWPALPLFFFVIALGVYLGLVLRLNSWDALVDPPRVTDVALSVLGAPPRLRLLGAGAALLWLVYEIVDVWIDGARARIGRWIAVR